MIKRTSSAYFFVRLISSVLSFSADRVERASPASLSFTVGKEDITGVSFVVFRKLPRVDVTGTVRCSSAEYVSGLRVELIERDSAGKEKKTNQNRSK